MTIELFVIVSALIYLLLGSLFFLLMIWLVVEQLAHDRQARMAKKFGAEG